MSLVQSNALVRPAAESFEPLLAAEVERIGRALGRKAAWWRIVRGGVAFLSALVVGVALALALPADVSSAVRIGLAAAVFLAIWTPTSWFLWTPPEHDRAALDAWSEQHRTLTQFERSRLRAVRSRHADLDAVARQWEGRIGELRVSELDVLMRVHRARYNASAVDPALRIDPIAQFERLQRPGADVGRPGG